MGRSLKKWAGGIGLVLVTAVPVFLVSFIVIVLLPDSHPLASYRVAITGSAAVLSDGVTIVYTDPDEMCQSPALTAAEAPDAVVLTLTLSGNLSCPGFPYWQLTPASGTDAPAAILGAGTGFLDGGSAVTTLNSQLGSRRLVDAVTGRTIPVFDQHRALTLPRPAGWATAITPGQEFSTAESYFGGPGAAVLVQILSSYQADRFDGSSLLIVQTTGGGWHPPPGTATRRVMVRGHHGLAAAGIIVWPDAGMTVAVIGLGPLAGEPGTFSRAPLPFSQLAAVASELEEPA